MGAAAWQYRLQRIGLGVTRGLSSKARARWLTTFYGAYQVLLGRGEALTWGDTAGRQKISRLRGFYRVARLHGQRHILPGVWRYLEGDAVPMPATAARGIDPSLFPSWMIGDLKAIAEVEPALYPSPDFLACFHRWQAPVNSAPGEVYAALWGQLKTSHYDVIVMAPWLREGGADKGVLQYTDHYANTFERVLLITTRPETSPWVTRVAPSVEVLETGRVLSHLPPEDQIAVVLRLLLELSPALVHVVQSDIGWRVISGFGGAIRANGAKILVSSFAHELNGSGRKAGYAATYLPAAREHLNGVLTDNIPFAHQLIREFALRPETVWPVHFWVDETSRAMTTAPTDRADTKHVLWASRVCLQKRPDLLLGIATAMPDILFDVYGSPDNETATLYRKLQRLENVHAHGIYGNFDEIVRDKRFDAFLYTTDSDGLPNVLLEATMAGLPIVCPTHIGGIRDLVSQDTGYPVADAGCIGDYVTALREILANPEEARRRAENALAVCRTRHTKSAFLASMGAVMVSVGMTHDVPRLATNQDRRSIAS